MRGQPSDAEVAALAVVLATLAGGPAEPPARPVRGRWSDPADRLRTPLVPGPDAWRAVYRPR